MRTPPSGLDDRRLAQVLVASWRMRPVALRYAPVGFGSHHPWIEASPWPDHDRATDQERAELVAMLARLHAAIPTVTGCARVDDLRIDGRASLDTALTALEGPWATGPFGEPTRPAGTTRPGPSLTASRSRTTS